MMIDGKTNQTRIVIPIPVRPTRSSTNPGVERVYSVTPEGQLMHENTVADDECNDVRNSDRNLDHEVDPSAVYVIPCVEGRVMKDKEFNCKHCKVFYRKKIIPKLLIYVAVLFLVIVSIIYIVKTRDSQNNMPTNKPDIFEQSSTPSYAPSYAPFDNVTARIVAVSGKATMIENSPQQRSLQWILQQVNTNQTYDDTQLIQRYSLMVLFYGLSGEQWWNKNSFGTYQHECDWYGISCSSTNRSVIEINLQSNNLQGQIPKEIALFSSMRRTRLFENSLTGTIPSEIGQLRYLESFLASRNLFTSSIPSEIGNCKDLRMLHLQMNKLTGPIPLLFNSLLIRSILLFDNKLSGTIPLAIVSYANLITLRLRENEFTGTIPSDIEPLNLIENLDFSNNNLNGTIPSSIQNLHRMKYLQLSDNYLTGTIPSNLNKLSSLVELHINNNDINGTIPESIQYLESVEIIDLSSNQISGTIPSSIGKLNSLNDLRIHSNMMTGTLPDEISDLSLPLLTSDCAEVPSKVSCSCCSECF